MCLGLIPGLGRSTGEGKGYPLQYSDLENSIDCIVHGVAKSQTRLSDFHLRVVIAFLPRSKCLLISWPQSPSAVILEPKKIIYVTASTFPLSVCHEVMGSEAIILGFFKVEFQVSLLTLLYHPHQEAVLFLFTFCYQSGIICISEVVDISPRSLHSSL